MTSFKQLALRALTGRSLTPLYRLFMRGRATILMLHRFQDPANGIAGHDPTALRRCLAWLRRNRYQLVDLQALLEGLRAGEPAWDRAVAFTIDDGYRDQAAIGGPVFAEFDCPVTTFVTTGFLDGQLWFWWDRIEFVFRETRRPSLTVALDSGQLTYTTGPAGFAQAQADFTNRCKQLSDSAKHVAIDNLAAAGDVALPAQAPAAYAPMSWPDLQAAETRGMRFGPHTVTHPILSRTTDEQSRDEIVESWRRLRVHARRPVPVFCYPNGQPGDFGPREYQTLDALGLSAVVGTPGYADTRLHAADRLARFTVPRINYPEDLVRLAQYVSGFEQVKGLVRRTG